MSKPAKCWIVELKTLRGWEPCYESEVNHSSVWATENAVYLRKKYSGSAYRVRQYQQVQKRRKS